MWDLEAILEALAADPSIGDGRMAQPTAVRLSDDVILLTFRIVGSDRSSLRSSVWVRSQGQWLIRFHQGTPVPPGEVGR